MNQIIRFSLKNKFAIWLLTIIITVAGLYSGMNMKLETIPDINMPIVTVTTIYPGAAPEEVSEKVTGPIEKKAANLPGVSVVSSTSFANASSIMVEYNYSKDMNEAKNEVKDVISGMEFPDGVGEPKISRVSFNAFPIMSMSVSAEGKDLAELTKIVEDEIAPEIEGIDGVATVGISGQQVEEAVLSFKKDKLAQYGLDEETVKQIIRGTDIEIPLGLFNFKDKQKTVVVDGHILTLKDLKNIEIPYTPTSLGVSPSSPMQSGQRQQSGAQQPDALQAGMTPTQGQMAVKPQLPTVKLSEIATIKLEGKAESISRTNGKESVALQVTKSQEANTVEVVNTVKAEMKKFEKTYKGVSTDFVFDQGKPIEDSVNTMLSKAVIGAIFAVIIILLFLRNFKSTIISVISIPLSLLMAILLLKEMDITLNVMTLGAMTVAIGRVIDDSIVVIENIFRRMSLQSEKLKGKELIHAATKEMFVPIASSTIVTIAVFLPLGLVEGPVGELFLPFALTIVFALLASLLVAITIVPAMASSLFKKGMKVKNHEEHIGFLAKSYKKVLNWSLNHKLLTFGLAILLLIGSFFLVPKIGVSFLANDEEKMIVATYVPNPGEKQEDVEKVALEVEKYFLAKKDVKTVQYSVGGDNPMNPGANGQALFFIGYKDDTENFSEEQVKVFKDLEKYSDKGEWGSQHMSSSGVNNAISLNVYGNDLKQIEPVVKEITGMMEDNRNLKNIKSSISESYDQYTLVADQEKLSKLGLTAGQIGMSLVHAGEPPVLTTIEKDGKEINVYVEVKKNEFKTLKELTDKKVQSPLGVSVPLKDVVDVKEEKSPDTIQKRNGKVYAQASAEVTSKDVAKINKDLEESVSKLDLPSGVSVEFGGVTEQINDSFKQLGLAMLAAVAIVYLMLVITFGGGLAPFAILFSLPFTIIGGLVALLIAGETISVSALIGALMLIGIVVTNAIVLIDRVIRKEEEGLSVRDALIEAGATRLRPILMTALATVGALIPLAIGVEGGGLISRGLGVTVIGGLISSTLLTLVVVPIVYEFLSKFRRKRVAE